MSRGPRVPLPALPPAGYHLGKSLFPPPDLSFPISKMKLLHLKSQKSLPTRVFSNLTSECSNGRVILMACLLGFLRFGGRCWEEGSNIKGPPPFPSYCLPCCTSGPGTAPSSALSKTACPIDPCTGQEVPGTRIRESEVQFVWFSHTLLHLIGSWLEHCLSARLEKKGEVVFKSSPSLALASDSQPQGNWTLAGCCRTRRASIYKRLHLRGRKATCPMRASRWSLAGVEERLPFRMATAECMALFWEKLHFEVRVSHKIEWQNQSWVMLNLKCWMHVNPLRNKHGGGGADFSFSIKYHLTQHRCPSPPF